MIDDLGPQPGYIGVFTRGTAPGAIPNGARIVKVKTEPGDYNPIGALGTVLGSMRPPAEVRRLFPDVLYFYFVEWDAMPGTAVGVMSTKIDKAPA
jgi:hypothetical protein